MIWPFNNYVKYQISVTILWRSWILETKFKRRGGSFNFCAWQTACSPTDRRGAGGAYMSLWTDVLPFSRQLMKVSPRLNTNPYCSNVVFLLRSTLSLPLCRTFTVTHSTCSFRSTIQINLHSHIMDNHYRVATIFKKLEISEFSFTEKIRDFYVNNWKLQRSFKWAYLK